MRKKREERLVLVDLSDRPVGEEEKLAAHLDGGKLHRAFSVFIENDRGEQLLQQRAYSKYHFRGLWANACCGHPRPDEGVASAARRRLSEELGIDAELREIFSFAYTAEDPESGLTERELDHVFLGRFDGFPQPHPDEIGAIRWAHPETLEREFRERPERFAPWLLEAGPRVFAATRAARPVAKSRSSRRGWGLLGVLVTLCAVFLVDVLLRSPAEGLPADDPHVMDEARSTRNASDGDGVWAPSGHPMWVQGAFRFFGLEPAVGRLMQVNLAAHLVLALLLALLAHYLATTARPESLLWPTLTALQCGIFILLFPPIRHWGQSVSLNGFAVLPLLVVAVAGRWLRASLPTERRRRAAGIAVGVSVLVGTLTDFLFWLLVPYTLVVQALRAWRGSPRASDPWMWTVLFPAIVALIAISVVDERVEVPSVPPEGIAGVEGLGGVVTSFRRHFHDGFRFLGWICIGLALVELVPRERSGSAPWVFRGMLLDLFFPVLAFAFVLAPWPEARSFDAVRYVPFVALAWTVLAPLVIDGFRGRRKKAVAWALYAALAFLSVWPGHREVENHRIPGNAFSVRPEFTASR